MKVWRAALGIALGGLLAVGCGVRPTGVIDAGEPATGLSRGMRLYYVSDTGLRAVPRPDLEVTNIASVVKHLTLGPSPAELRGGLTSVVDLGGYGVSAAGREVTVELDGAYRATGRDQGTGQLVCSLARGQAVLEPKVGADDVEVVIRPARGPQLGPFKCADFLTR
ncbi:hypothetical protein ACFYVL_27620 [Streptomyces sp. NPDC004111]|uniref:hypothetical protein n=1 Tax=Streptomyces sp. NPDC004111 TaxID=3364690 RepID=UPI003673F96A